MEGNVSQGMQLAAAIKIYRHGMDTPSGGIMKFDMGEQTLSNLSKQTDGSHGDLGGLIRQLVAAAEPLEGKFNGQGRAAFDKFKSHTDEISQDLNSSLAKILTGQQGMDHSFATGDQAMADNANQAGGSAPFDAARFGSTR